MPREPYPFFDTPHRSASPSTEADARGARRRRHRRVVRPSGHRSARSRRSGTHRGDAIGIDRLGGVQFCDAIGEFRTRKVSSKLDRRRHVRVMAVRSGIGVGVAEGYDTFFRAVFPRALAVAQRVTGQRSTAEDAAIYALARAHFRWTRVSGLERPDLWVIKVAARTAIRQLRFDDRPARPSVTANTAAAPDPAEAVALRQTLTVALRALPRRQCEVIVLHYLVGLSETEVAEVLEISHGTVKTHLRRGMAALRRSIGSNLKEEHLARLA